MPHRYIKTSAGRHEVQVHDLPLGRSLRNLLLVINDSQPVDYWLSNIKGVTLADVAQLERQGLIAAVAEPEIPQVCDQSWDEALAAINHTDTATLARVLKRLAWPMLRGTRAYRFVQDLEDCSDEADLRQMARAFLGQVRGELGAQAVQQVQQALSAPASPVSAPAPVAQQIVLEVPHIEREPEPVARAMTYRLRRWPSPRTLQAPGFTRLASLLSARALTLGQLVELGRVDEVQGRQFLAEMRTLALIEELPTLLAVPAPAIVTPTQGLSKAGNLAIMPSALSGSGSHRASGANPVTRGLLGRLREHLGLR